MPDKIAEDFSAIAAGLARVQAETRARVAGAAPTDNAQSAGDAGDHWAELRAYLEGLPCAPGHVPFTRSIGDA